MDHDMPMHQGDEELSWPESHRAVSEDNSLVIMPATQVWAREPTRRLTTGQLSPISTELDVSLADCASASLSTTLHSATSTSSHDSWSTTYSDGAEEGDGDQEALWEQGSDDILMAPKLEPLEDDEFLMEDVREAPGTPRATASVASTDPKPKRPRGRPRKHPLVPQTAASKSAKGRSKTGCITCRKRKKKCDEAKPRCMNCEKNNAVCEGYHEKTVWKSGRERAEEARRANQNLPSITMQPIFRGVETPEDLVFLSHYINQLSGVLTVEGQHKNAFKDMLLQMAVGNRGLMHSILALASRHIDYNTPYGARLLDTHGKTTQETLLARSEHHYSAAMQMFHADIEREKGVQSASQRINLSVLYGQMLCLLLQTKAEDGHHGQHRLHLQAYKNLIQSSPPEDSAFLVFITEFFQFHIFADELIRYPVSLDAQTTPQPRLASEEWEPWVPIQPARMIGVADGLFKYLAQITSIRNVIRTNMLANIDPVVDYTSLWRAAEIGDAIQSWAPKWPPGDGREAVALLYQQMMWVYLYRTIYPPSSMTAAALSSHNARHGGSPPLSPTSPVHSAHDPPPGCGTRPGSPGLRADSPPPIRYPPQHDARITIAVDESLSILDSFKPGDPVQALLLIPCVVIGCACFAPSQQARLSNAVRAVRGYTGFRNADRVLQVLEEVWRLMERGDWARVWDWQGVARSLDLDFSCA